MAVAPVLKSYNGNSSTHDEGTGTLYRTIQCCGAEIIFFSAPAPTLTVFSAPASAPATAIIGTLNCSKIEVLHL